MFGFVVLFGLNSLLGPFILRSENGLQNLLEVVHCELGYQKQHEGVEIAFFSDNEIKLALVEPNNQRVDEQCRVAHRLTVKISLRIPT